MTGVLLTQLWVHDASDLSNNIAVRFLDEGETWPIAAEVRRYAGGRFRAVSTPGVSRSIPMALKRSPRVDLHGLQDLIGTTARLVMIRLPRGRKLWGIIADLSSIERHSFDVVDITFTVQEVTVDEAV